NASPWKHRDALRFLRKHAGCPRFLVALAVGVALGGCGGSKPGNAPARAEVPPPKPAAPVDNRPVIVAFGDSLTAGFGAEPGNSYPDFLQKELDRAGIGWRVVNAGVSGDTTIDGVNRLSEVLGYKPSVVILEFGGNDGLRGLPLETTRANLEQMVATLRTAGVTVILAGMTLPPNYGPEYIRGFEQIYRELSTKYKLTRIPFLLEGVATDRSLMQRDGLHPTAKGNEKVAATVMKYVKPALH
ncbi:MAG TPA: arylesterase, partial [Bryobacteraceae bacterium]|nr:arylesterase [Bryobacteraceae bacterium]